MSRERIKQRRRAGIKGALALLMRQGIQEHVDAQGVAVGGKLIEELRILRDYRVLMNVNEPSGVTRPEGDSGAATIREIATRGTSGRSVELNVAPPSVPASHGSRLNR